MKSLYCTELKELSFYVWESKILQKNRRNVIFSTRRIGKEEVVRYYFDSVIKETFMGYLVKTKVYGREICPLQLRTLKCGHQAQILLESQHGG